jgi:hypothetical protein
MLCTWLTSLLDDKSFLIFWCLKWKDCLEGFKGIHLVSYE